MKNETPSEEKTPPPALPCPEPLHMAVETGVFHRCRDGSLKPSPAEVASITREHANELVSIACDIVMLDRCVQTGAHLTTQHAGRPEARRERNRQYSQKLLHQLKLREIGGMSAYADAFGHDAMEQLHRYVDFTAAELTRESSPPAIQLDLF